MSVRCNIAGKLNGVVSVVVYLGLLGPLLFVTLGMLLMRIALAFSVLRVYAICGKKIIPPLAVLLLMLVNIVYIAVRNHFTVWPSWDLCS